MKRFLLLMLLCCGAAFAQCSDAGSLFSAGATGTPVDNTVTLCSSWTFQVQTQLAVSSYTAILQGDFGAGFITMLTCNTVSSCSQTLVNSVPQRTRVLLSAVNGGYINYTYAGSVPKPPEPGISINGVSCPISGSCTIPAGVPVPQFVQTNTVTVTGVTVATTLVGTGVGTVTLPANFFSAPGTVLDIDYGGNANWAASATLDSLAISLGGTNIGSGSLSTSGTGDFACSLRATVTARTVGAAGTVILKSPGMLCNNSSGSSPFAITLGTSNTPVTVNTTVPLTFNITITPGAATKTYVSTNLVLRGY